jgi:probable rRNA maturation factor
MVELNVKYREKDYVANVLSFSQLEGEALTGSARLLGDVVICTDRAADDAADLGYTEHEMVLYLLIHGILHLIGYLHDAPEDAQVMQEKVDRLFRKFYPDDV